MSRWLYLNLRCMCAWNHSLWRLRVSDRILCQMHGKLNTCYWRWCMCAWYPKLHWTLTVCRMPYLCRRLPSYQPEPLFERDRPMLRVGLRRWLCNLWITLGRDEWPLLYRNWLMQRVQWIWQLRVLHGRLNLGHLPPSLPRQQKLQKLQLFWRLHQVRQRP